MSSFGAVTIGDSGVGIVYKQIGMEEKLQIEKSGKKTQLTGRRP